MTDIIKTRLRCKDVNEYLQDQALRQRNLDFLSREFEIIQPKMIVAVGGKSKKILSKNFPEEVEKIYCIPHYSMRRTREFKKRRQKFKKEMKKIREMYSKL